jgi:MFS family permease
MHDASAIIETDVPARLDRLPWSRFHSLVIVALGITWILDGLEVTIAGSIVGALEESPVLHFTPQQIGLVATAYLAGAVVGALLFGYLTDRLGRRKLFFVTLALYLTATAATALSWDFWSFAVFRVLTGAGIGGEYAAINSAIQELIPARYRGRTDLAVNGSFWVGAALGALGAVVLLQPGLLPPDWGWRAAFGIGAVLGLGILFLRQWIPESPRWLMLHARTEECEAVLCGIEERVLARPGAKPLAEAGARLRLVAASHTPILRMIRAILRDYPRRAVLGLGILFLRQWIPESPRWLMLHARTEECEAVLCGIEERVLARPGAKPLAEAGARLRLVAASHTPILRMIRAILRDYPRRAVLGLVLMASQAFFYNAIFFSYALVLTRFYGVPSDAIGWYMLPFALGNFMGPLLLGPLFDTLGRKPMIAFTYAISGVLLAVVGWLFREGIVDAATLTACWSGIFFFASAAASAAYLTVSESFPLEARALAIAFFYAVGTAIGGVASPWLFGVLVGSGDRGDVFLGYLFGAVLMVGAAVVEVLIGVKAERQPLESVARPISALDG